MFFEYLFALSKRNLFSGVDDVTKQTASAGFAEADFADLVEYGSYFIL